MYLYTTIFVFIQNFNYLCLMNKEEISKLEERFQKTIYGNTMMLKYLGFTLGKVNLNENDIQEVMDYLIEKEEYELCIKLKNHINMTKFNTS